MLSNFTIADAVSFADLEFATRDVIDFTASGAPYVRTVRFGVPRIPPKILRTTVFLYRDAEAARSGQRRGGTGFVVGFPSAHPKGWHCYFVTNWHVACQGGSSVVRVNRPNEDPEIFDFDSSEWTFSPKYDIAAIRAPLDITTHEAAFIGNDMFLTREIKEERSIGPGDDVFMIGRFTSHDGKNKNVPSVRFGNISIDPTPIQQENGALAESYCLDMRSRGGYSGSPVFIYRTPGYDLGQDRDPEKPTRLLRAGVNHLTLLGIHWGQFPERWEIESDGTLKTEEAGENLIAGKSYIKGLSGMTCVLPSWSIQEVLDLPKLKDERDKMDAELRAEHGDSLPMPESEEEFDEDGARSRGDETLRRMLESPPKPHDKSVSNK